MESIGLRALADNIFALGLLLVILLLGGGIGLKVLNWLKLEDLTDLERAMFGVPIGLGVIAYGVLALGLAGLLFPWAVLIWLFLLGIWSLREWSDIVNRLLSLLGSVKNAWRELNGEKKSLLLVGGIIFVLTLLQALTPPWDYDGLLYHLQGPRLFLSAGRILPVPDNWLTYYPATVEMLFTLGMSFGSDNFAKLIHFSWASILVLVAYACGKRFLDDLGGWLAAAVLVGIPIYPIWASIAYIDIAWAAFEFLAVFSVLIWLDDRRPQWLIMAGLSMGFGIGSKYLALGGGVVICLWIIWHSRAQGWRTVLSNGFLFSGVACIVASPWYVKNWLWTGNPIYPLFLGSAGWSTERVDLWTAYMHSFGTGRDFLDYLLLPINLYAHYDRFGTFLGSIEIPSLLFLLILLYPWTEKSTPINGLFWLVVMRFVIWAVGTQQTRYLLPLFPSLSVLTAHVVLTIIRRVRIDNLGRVLGKGLVLGMVVVTLVYSILYLSLIRPLGVIIGLESKDAFLHRTIHDYPAVQFVKNNLPPQARVFMMWDGQGYYCDDRCLPDIDHAQWTLLASKFGDIPSLANHLRQQGVTHLLFSVLDLDFMLQHDPTSQHQYAFDYFLEEFRPVCTREAYSDPNVTLFQLTCP